MNARELVNDSFPPLTLSDNGLKGLGWMEEFRVEHLPIVDQSKYLGLISEQDILKLTALDQPLETQKLSLIHPFISANKPVFEVVRSMSKDKLTVIPVLDENQHYLGLITLSDVLKHYTESGIFEDANGVIVIEMDPKQYSMAEIARLIEQEDARIMSSYVTPNARQETIDVTLKINQRELSRILSSFSRHGYNVKEHYHQTDFADDLKSRYDMLMNYLGI
ncbi:MAG: hypothetical protein RL021_1508 [Bacteroidota bacterium]|jgi:CBS domain-containing protein